MNIQGLSLQGAGYGGLSPKDITGLKIWLKASSGVEFQLGNAVNKWNDLSGNENHFLPLNGSGSIAPYAGVLINTQAGLALSGLSGSGAYLTCLNLQAHNFLLDGSPYSLMLIQRVRNLEGSTTIIRNIPQQNANSLLYQLYLPNGATVPQTVFQFRDSSANTRINVQIDTPELVSNTNNIVNFTNYGYGSQAEPFHFLFNNEIKATRAYVAPPIYTPANALSYQPNVRNAIYEIIIYDHTGKTPLQIDQEMQNLYDNYILKQYPLLWTT